MAQELSLYDPDIVAFSESPDEEVMQEIARLMGLHHVRFPSGRHWPGVVLSRYPIVESKNVPLLQGERPKALFTRHWGRAVIQLPNGEEVVIFPVKTRLGTSSWNCSSEESRP